MRNGKSTQEFPKAVFVNTFYKLDWYMTFYKKTVFSKSIKKTHLWGFWLGNWGAFFSPDLEKTHLNLPPKIPQKIKFSLRILKKTHLNLPKIPQKITIFLTILKKKKKRTSICNPKSLKNHIFSSLFWKKRTSVYHPKHSCSWLYTKNQPIRDTLEKKSERYPQGKQKMEIYEKNGGNDSLEKVPT